MEKYNSSVSLIICAYNEERFIEEVARELLCSPLVGEMLIVNDGSNDNTPQIIDKLAFLDSRVVPVHFKTNVGKADALATGILRAKNKILVFFDADYRKANSKLVSTLAKPLIEGRARLVIGKRRSFLTDPLFDLIHGERAALREDLITLVDKLKGTRFGAEMIINLIYLTRNWKMMFVDMPGLIHVLKADKLSPVDSIKESVKEAKQVLKAFKLCKSELREYLQGKPQDWYETISAKLKSFD